jgi:hypothetical protein
MFERAEQRGVRLTLAMQPVPLNLLGDPSWFDVFVHYESDRRRN